jgi:hypothetical protein
MSRPALVLAVFLAAFVSGCGNTTDATQRQAKGDEPKPKAKETLGRKERTAEGGTVTTFTLVGAHTVFNAYKQDEAAAKAEYENKRVRIIGAVASVKDVGSEVHVSLTVEEKEVRCKFPKRNPALANLKLKEFAVIDGTGEGREGETPIFRNCEVKGSGYPTWDKAHTEAIGLDLD